MPDQRSNSHGLDILQSALPRCVLNKGAKNSYQGRVASALTSYLGGTIRGMNGVAESIGGIDDHVHLMLSLRPIHCLAEVMRDLIWHPFGVGSGDLRHTPTASYCLTALRTAP